MYMVHNGLQNNMKYSCRWQIVHLKLLGGHNSRAVNDTLYISCRNLFIPYFAVPMTQVRILLLKAFSQIVCL